MNVPLTAPLPPSAFRKLGDSVYSATKSYLSERRNERVTDAAGGAAACNALETA
jgi:hypothetical protein